MATRKKDLPLLEVWLAISVLVMIIMAMAAIDFFYWSVNFVFSF